MHAEYLFINQSGNGETVEAVGEHFPDFDVESSFAFIIESIDPIYGRALMVTA